MSTTDLRSCPTHGLRYDASVSTGCIRCRRAPPVEPPPKRRVALLLAALAVVVLVSVSVVGIRVLGAPPPASAPAVLHLQTKNSSGRSGAYYIPPLSSAARAAPIPLLVFLHGTGGNGNGGVAAFRALADERGFAILAPESRVTPDGQVTWEVGSHPGETSDDRLHVMACLAELLATEHLTLDPLHVLVAGHSGGASSAPWLATNEEPFTAFAVLHGGTFPGGFGRRHVRGWFSTGSADPLRPPAMVTRAYEASRGPGTPYEMHVFAGGHDLGEEERRALVEWWL